MSKKQRIENFTNEDEARERILELKEQGVDGDNIYILADSEDSFVKREDLGVHYKNAEGKFRDKFSSLLSKEKPEAKVLEGFNLSEEDKDKYARDLRNGHILLYAEEADNDKR